MSTCRAITLGAHGHGTDGAGGSGADHHSRTDDGSVGGPGANSSEAPASQGSDMAVDANTDVNRNGNANVAMAEVKVKKLHKFPPIVSATMIQRVRPTIRV